MPASVSHDARERELVQATRRLFDERGMQDAPVEQIAKEVGIARGLIYRQFSSKEELYVLTVTDYLAELSQAMETAPGDDRLAAQTRAFAEFCVRYPAFVDCALSIMHRPAQELQAAVSESVWLRLGVGMASCIGPLCDVLRERDHPTPDYTANVLWTQGLGLMHLARIGVGLHRTEGGGPALFPVATEDVVQTCVDAALALSR
jgi:AcrR family transcriptional regulator